MRTYDNSSLDPTLGFRRFKRGFRCCEETGLCFISLTIYRSHKYRASILLTRRAFRFTHKTRMSYSVLYDPVLFIICHSNRKIIASLTIQFQIQIMSTRNNSCFIIVFSLKIYTNSKDLYSNNAHAS